MHSQALPTRCRADVKRDREERKAKSLINELVEQNLENIVILFLVF